MEYEQDKPKIKGIQPEELFQYTWGCDVTGGVFLV